MDQAGHRQITAHGVVQLFNEHSNAESIFGMDMQHFYKELNHWQAYADRPWGPTWHPSIISPGAQAQHSMANPFLSGPENLKVIVDFVTSRIDAAYTAHLQGDTLKEMANLGSAVHALEDSYSGAHMFRDVDNSGDPHAHVQAINNFDPGGIAQTHDGEFDKVHVTAGSLDRPSDQAAATAVSELLGIYVTVLSSSQPNTHATFHEAVSSFYQGDNAVVLANNLSKVFHEHWLAHHAGEISYNPAASAFYTNHGSDSKDRHDGASTSDNHASPSQATPNDSAVGAICTAPVDPAHNSSQAQGHAHSGAVTPGSVVHHVSHAHTHGHSSNSAPVDPSHSFSANHMQLHNGPVAPVDPSHAFSANHMELHNSPGSPVDPAHQGTVNHIDANSSAGHDPHHHAGSHNLDNVVDHPSDVHH